MSDIERHKRNVKRMVDAGAPEADVDAYLAGEGVTPLMLRGGSTSLKQYEAQQKSLSPDDERLPGLSRVEREDFDLRKRMQPARSRLLDLGATLGGADELVAAGNTLVEPLLGFVGKDPRAGMSMGDRYGSHLRVQQALNKSARDEASGGWELLGGLGSMAASAPKTAVGVVGAAPEIASGGWNAVKQFGQEFMKPKNLAAVGTTGAAFGATHAALDNDGGVQERLLAAPSGAAMGAAGGIALGAGLGSFLAAKQGRQVAKSQASNQASQGRADDLQEWQAAGVTPIGPEISSNRLVRDSSPNLAQSWFGAPLRQQAAQATDDVATAAQKLITTHTQGRPSSDLGADLQGVMRENLRGYSKGDPELQAMSNAELERITGPVSERGFSVPRPTVEPVAPRQVEPVPPNYSRHRPEDENVPGLQVEAKYPRFEDVPEPPFTASQAQRAEAQLADIYARYQAAVAARERTVEQAYAMRQAAVDALSKDTGLSVGEMGRVIGRRNELYAGLKSVKDVDPRTTPIGKREGWHPDLDEALTPEWRPKMRAIYDQADREFKEIERLTQQHAKLMTERERWTTQAQRAREQEWHERVAQERERAETGYREKLTQAQQEAARRRAEAEAERQTQLARQSAEDDARAITQARQSAADEVWEQEMAKGASFKLGSTRESYPTEASAAYQRLERELPGERFNPLGAVGYDRGQRTKTSELLEDVLSDARASLQVRGGGGALDENGAVRPDLMEHLRSRLGPEVGNIVARLSEANASRQGTNTFGIRSMRTQIGRAIEGARESGADASLLKRLYASLSEDMHLAVSRQGQPPYAKTSTGREYDIDQAGGAAARGERKPDAVYYVKPEHAALLNKGNPVRGELDLGMHPMRTFRINKDGSGNETLAVFRGEGAGQIDGSSKIPFRRKPEKGLVPVELHDGGMRARIGSPVSEIGVSPGERSVNMMKNIDKQYQDMVTTLRTPLRRLYGDKVTPIEAMSKLSEAATSGDLHTLRSFMRVMSEKDDPIRGAAAIVSHVTGGAQDLSTFLKGMRKLPAESRKVLLTNDASKAWFQSLERLERIGGRLEKYQTAIQRGGEVNLGVKANQVALASAFAGLPTMIAYGIGAHATARFLSSPKYVNALTRVTEAGLSNSRAAFAGNLKRLSGIAAADGEFGQAVLQAMASAGTSPAHASFVGEDAKGVDRRALRRAKDMNAAGADRDAIWKATGWFKQSDGKWRTEVDDSDAELSETAKLTIKAVREDGGPRAAPLSDMLKHDKLFAADPSLKKILTQIEPFKGEAENWFGWYDKNNDQMMLNPKKDEGKLKSVMLHEAQHASGDRSGFAYGKTGVDDEDYFRQPGEALAYAVEDRLGMSAEDRWNKPPWESFRVPEHRFMWPPRKRNEKQKEQRK